MQNVSEPFSWIARFSHLGTQLFTLFSGELVGKDKYGNRYFRERKAVSGEREKRWVMYKGRPEASEVPPEWHGWLHYTLDQPLPDESEFHRPWIKPHLANLTFSDSAYRPPSLTAGKRDKATGDYEAWTPVKHNVSKQ